MLQALLLLMQALLLLLQALVQALVQALLQAVLPPRVSLLWPRSNCLPARHGCEGVRGRMSRRNRGRASAACNKACNKACGVSLLLGVLLLLLLLLHTTCHTCMRNTSPPCIYAASCMQHTSIPAVCGGLLGVLPDVLPARLRLRKMSRREVPVTPTTAPPSPPQGRLRKMRRRELPGSLRKLVSGTPPFAHIYEV